MSLVRGQAPRILRLEKLKGMGCEGCWKQGSVMTVTGVGGNEGGECLCEQGVSRVPQEIHICITLHLVLKEQYQDENMYYIQHQTLKFSHGSH